MEEVSFTSPVHTAGNATKRKGEPLVDLLFYHKGDKICRGGVGNPGNNARVCAIHPDICQFARHKKKLPYFRDGTPW